MLDNGKDLGMPDGVLINGKGPYRYNNSLVPAGIEHETINVQPGQLFFKSFQTLEIGVCKNESNALKQYLPLSRQDIPVQDTQCRHIHKPELQDSKS
jgi:hypothetical protein